MDSTTKIYFDRANNEIKLAESIVLLSENDKVKQEVFNIPKSMTFYSAVISHSYYAIFYSAKAYLQTKGIAFTERQGQHQRVYFEFSKLVKKGIIDKELLDMYKEVMIKAETLLEILRQEKDSRNEFTYEKLPQANKEPARNSLKNAQQFYSHLFGLSNVK